MLANLRIGEVVVIPAELDPAKLEAHCEWSWVNGRLHIKTWRDEAQGGFVAQTLHEVVHAHLHDALAKIFDEHDELHEAALRGVEQACVKHLEKRRSRFEQWRRAISEKMEER